MPQADPNSWHSLDAAEVVARLKSDAANGLTWDEARRRLEHHGPNRVEGRSGPGRLARFLLQFHQPLIYILIAASVVTFVLAEYVDSAVILGVVVLIAIVGYVQESRALSALAALAKTMAEEATVVRGGDRHRIPAAEVVPGDIVVVQPGDKIPADLRLIHVRDLQLQESAFTGESTPVLKGMEPVAPDAEVADRTGMAFATTLTTYGRATGIVVATGNDTQVGKISELIKSAEDLATPLTQRIARFSRVLLRIILALAMVTFAIGLLRGEDAGEVFLASVALAVAAIPEGLPAAMTITLAIGVNRMAGRRAIIRKLPAVETLGSTTVICSDKTGTLTQNEMTVQQVWTGGRRFVFSGIGYAPKGHVEAEDGDAPFDRALERCLLAGLLCNDSSVYEHEERWIVRGDPTEAALIVAAAKAGFRPEESEQQLPRIDAIPFESANQYMATLHMATLHEQPQLESNVVFVKGAAEVLLPRCLDALDSDGDRAPFDLEAGLDEVHRMAAAGLRVLALAQLEVHPDKRFVDHADVDRGLTFLGLQAMMDPPRQEAIEAVRACRRAGITVKMITGDHAVTAAAVAKVLGIGSPGDPPIDGVPRAMSGRELERTSDQELVSVSRDVHVFARVPPDGKLRLVRALQSQGHVVAMTGDGVNDGPALQQANIGIAMGITGTEVAKDAADMVLADDNFASIEAAVEEGRGVFANLIKFLTWTLPTNLGEGLVILGAILLGATLPLLPVQLLWVNLTTAILLGLTLAFEPKEQGIMERPPRDPAASIINRPMVIRMFLVAAIMVAGAFGLFYWAEGVGASTEEARTIAVTVFIVVETFYLFNCRSLVVSMFSLGVFSNLWTVVGAATIGALQMAFIYAPPMNTLFRSEPVRLEAWPFILALGLLTFAVVEGEKYIRNRLGIPAIHRAHSLAAARTEPPRP
jgi:cation-transporting P-type ATPase F